MTRHLFIIFILTMIPSQAFSKGWSLNIGYHNPPASLVGVNFLYLGENFGGELGVGWVNVDREDTSKDDDKEEDTATLAIFGDANLKYLFGSGTVRPYIQGGFTTGLSGAVGKVNGFSASTGQGFGGGGIFLGGSPIYLYASYNVAQSFNFVQGGLGFYL